MDDNELLEKDRVATPGKLRTKQAVKAATTAKVTQRASKEKQSKKNSSTHRSGTGKKRKITASDHEPVKVRCT